MACLLLTLPQCSPRTALRRCDAARSWPEVATRSGEIYPAKSGRRPEAITSLVAHIICTPEVVLSKYIWSVCTAFTTITLCAYIPYPPATPGQCPRRVSRIVRSFLPPVASVLALSPSIKEGSSLPPATERLRRSDQSADLITLAACV